MKSNQWIEANNVVVARSLQKHASSQQSNVFSHRKIRMKRIQRYTMLKRFDLFAVAPATLWKWKWGTEREEEPERYKEREGEI